MDWSTSNLPQVHGWTLALNGQFNFHQKPIQSKATYSHISNIQNKNPKNDKNFSAQIQIPCSQKKLTENSKQIAVTRY